MLRSVTLEWGNPRIIRTKNSFMYFSHCSALPIYLMQKLPLMQSKITPNSYIFLFLLKLGRIFATFGYKPAQMTALSNFSLSVEDSKVSNVVLQTVNLNDQKLSISLSIYPSWYQTWDPWGLCYSQTQLQADARQIVLSCYAASRKQQQLSHNSAVQKGSSHSPSTCSSSTPLPRPPNSQNVTWRVFGDRKYSQQQSFSVLNPRRRVSSQPYKFKPSFKGIFQENIY